MREGEGRRERASCPPQRMRVEQLVTILSTPKIQLKSSRPRKLEFFNLLRDVEDLFKR